MSMDARAAKGIAANIAAIAEATANIALIDSGVATCWPDKYTARSNAIEAKAKAQSAIADWLMQPMTWR